MAIEPAKELNNPALDRTALEYISNTAIKPHLQESGTAKIILTDSIMGSEQRSKPAVRLEKGHKWSEPTVKRRNITRQNGKPKLKRSPSMALKPSDGAMSSIDQSSVERESSQPCALMLAAEDQEEAWSSINEVPPKLPPRRTDLTMIAEPSKITSIKTWDSATTARDSIPSRSSIATITADTHPLKLAEGWFDPSLVQQLVSFTVKNKKGMLDWCNVPRHKENAIYFGKYIAQISLRHKSDGPPERFVRSTAYGERLHCKY